MTTSPHDHTDPSTTDGANRSRMGSAGEASVSHDSNAPEALDTLLRDVGTSIPGAIYRFRYSTDGGYRLDYVSESFRKLTGLAETIDLHDFDNWLTWVPADHTDPYLDSIEQSRRSLTPWMAEWPIDVPTGRLWLQGMSQPHLDTNGDVVWNGLLLDITARKQTEQELRLAEMHYRSLFEHTAEGVYRTSPTGELLEVNSPLVRMHGCASKQALIEATDKIGTDWYVDPSDRQRLFELIEHGDAVVDFETTCYRVGTGETFRSCENTRAIRDDRGEILFYQGTIRDITPQHRQRRLDHARTAILEQIARGEPLAPTLYEIVGTLESYHGHNTSAILRLEGEYLDVVAAPALGHPCIEALQDRRPDQLGGAIAAARQSGDECLASDHPPRAGAGERLATAMHTQGYGELLAAPIRDPHAIVIGFLAIFVATPRSIDEGLRHVTHEMAQITAIAFDQNRLVENLVQKAQHDALTGLPNRALLGDRLHQLLQQAERYGHGVAVLVLDLDEFKPVNDTLGHKAGDALLCEVANRLQDCVRTPDTVARLGGDEYVIVLPLEEPGRAGLVAERITNSLVRSFTIEGHPITLGASIGIAVYPEDGIDAESLLHAADQAMYAAKRSPDLRYAFYRPGAPGAD